MLTYADVCRQGGLLGEMPTLACLMVEHRSQRLRGRGGRQRMEGGGFKRVLALLSAAFLAPLLAGTSGMHTLTYADVC